MVNEDDKDASAAEESMARIRMYNQNRFRKLAANQRLNDNENEKYSS
jgi:hypothetical protein